MIGSFVNTVTGQQIHTDGLTKKELTRRFRGVVAANGFRKTGWKMIGSSRQEVHGVAARDPLAGSEEEG